MTNIELIMLIILFLFIGAAMIDNETLDNMIEYCRRRLRK